MRTPVSTSEARELDRVDDAARGLRRYIAQRSDNIDAFHVHPAQSAVIQGLIKELLLDMGLIANESGEARPCLCAVEDAGTARPPQPAGAGIHGDLRQLG